MNDQVPAINPDFDAPSPDDTETPKAPPPGKLKKSSVCMTLARVILAARLPDPLLSAQWAPYPVTFVPLVDPLGEELIYELQPGNVLVPSSVARFKTTLMRYWQNDCKAHHASADFMPADAQAVLEFWKGRAERDTPFAAVAPIQQLSGQDWTFHRLPFDLRAGPTPTWDEVMRRTGNSKALKAWVGSLFEPEADKSQYVWLYGAGSEGKSSIAELIGGVMGPARVNIQRTPSKEDRFWALQFVGKRLGIFPDCNDYTFVTTGLFKTLTGDRFLDSDRKNASFIQVDMRAKFMFLANRKPDISSERADQRRAIFCPMTPPEGVDVLSGEQKAHWRRLMGLELPSFLGQCVAVYRELCPHHGPIPVDPELGVDLGNHNEEHWHALFEGNWRLAAGTGLSVNAVERRLQDLRYTKPEKDAFKAWMERVIGVSRKRHKIPVAGGKTKQVWFWDGLAAGTTADACGQILTEGPQLVPNPSAG